MDECIRCDTEAVYDDGMCSHHHWATIYEIRHGWPLLFTYLKRWAEFREFEAAA